MSFQISISPNRKAATRFIGAVRRLLQDALIDNEDVSRADIARALGVHRSVITRQLQGTSHMSVGRVAEIASMLGYQPKLLLVKPTYEAGRNVHGSGGSLSPLNVKKSVGSSAMTVSKVLTAGKVLEKA